MNQLADLLADLPPEPQPPEKGSPQGRILAATRELLAERGPGGVAMRAVAARAKVNQAMIHYYFGTKERLLDTVVAQEVLQILRDVVGGLTGFAPSAELFVQHPLRLLDVLRGDPLRMQLVRLALTTEPERLRRVIRALGRHGILGAANALGSLAAAARARGELRDVDARSLLLFLLANAYGLVFMGPVAREVTGFALDDDVQWQEHRRNLETLLRHAIVAQER